MRESVREARRDIFGARPHRQASTPRSGNRRLRQALMGSAILSYSEPRLKDYRFKQYDPPVVKELWRAEQAAKRLDGTTREAPRRPLRAQIGHRMATLKYNRNLGDAVDTGDFDELDDESVRAGASDGGKDGSSAGGSGSEAAVLDEVRQALSGTGIVVSESDTIETITRRIEKGTLFNAPMPDAAASGDAAAPAAEVAVPAEGAGTPAASEAGSRA